jgi:hypothetical protein
VLGLRCPAGCCFEIVERDDGYIGITDAARYFVGPELWSELVPAQ